MFIVDGGQYEINCKNGVKWWPIFDSGQYKDRTMQEQCCSSLAIMKTIGKNDVNWWLIFDGRQSEDRALQEQFYSSLVTKNVMFCLCH